MSTLVVEVTPVLERKPHPNADRLEFIKVKGWWVAVQKGSVEIGQPVVYIPPDAVIPESYAEQLGIAKYCSPLRRDLDGVQEPGLRVRAARLRGEASYGTIDLNVRPGWTIGQDVKEELGIRKWEPPRISLDGDADRPVPSFHQYTNIENLRNFPLAIPDGTSVVISEKLHGKNWRGGLILNPNEETGEAEYQWMAGSHEVRRKEFDNQERPSDFWIPLANPRLRELIQALSDQSRSEGGIGNVIVFGELINTQKGFSYGYKNSLPVRVFDISVDMKYLDFDRVRSLCERHEVEMVPLLFEGEFSWEIAESFVDGKTLVAAPNGLGNSFPYREGIVIKSAVEQFTDRLPGSGRMIGKLISVDYAEYKNRKGAEEVESSDY